MPLAYKEEKMEAGMERRLNQYSILKQIESAPYVGFTPLEKYPFLRYGFSTRLGGVSRGMFASMNLGFCRGDSDENVIENYKRLCDSLGISPEHLIFTDQVHKTNVRVATSADWGKGFCRERDYAEIDGHITNEPGVPLLVFGADCVPLFFVDPVKRAIGVAHAGWKGTVGKIGAATIKKLIAEYGCNPADLEVVIGPSIGSCCYEVGSEVAEAVMENFLEQPEQVKARLLIAKENGKYMFDLWEANRIVLLENGVLDEHITKSGLCTMCRQDLFFSHRATEGKRGSMAGFLMLA